MTLRAPRRLAALIAAPALVATGVALGAPIADAADSKSEPTYKGSALALSAKVNIAGTSVLDNVLPELVTYPPGSKKSLIELPEELSQLVGLKVLNASSEVSNGVLNSNAHTAGLGVLGEVVTARVINADCSANQGDVTGDSQVAGLTLAGTKIPVDPGPNLKIEIPDALAAFVKGSIVIDEQVPTADGGVQIRALHINLVVAPTALDDALNSVIKTVREAAESVKVALEQVTGESLETLIGKAAPAKAPKPAKIKASHGAQSAEAAEIRTEAAAPQAPAAPAAPAEATETQKTDDANLDSETASEAAEAAEAEQADAQAPEQSDSATVADAPQQTAEQAAAESAEAARAERSEKGAKQNAAPTAPDSTDPAAPAPAEAVPAAPAAPADTAPKTAQGKGKSDASQLPAVDKVQTLADSIAGAIGVDIVVSQVTCDGKPGVASVNELPGTGGNGHAARNVAATGLGLLMVGGAAVYVTRRRGRHVSL